MQQVPSRSLAALVLACLTLSGCAGAQAATTAMGAPEKPATTVPIAGSQVKKVILSADGAKRDGVETTPVTRDATGKQSVIPVSAVYYDADGATWVYTSPAPLQYVRQSVTLGPITGDTAVLTAGPPVGANVVSTGEAELYGVEFGVGGEQP